MIRDDETEGRKGRKKSRGSGWKGGERETETETETETGREREKESERKGWEGEKAWCNGGTSLRVSAPHQRVELQRL